MVDHGGITLNNPIDVEVASETSIRNLLILQAPDGDFDGLASRSARSEKTHADASSADRSTLDVLVAELVLEDSLGARLKVNFLIRDAVIACPSMYEYRRDWLLRHASPLAVDSAIPFVRDGKKTRVI